jgi:hypothetical protein
VDKRAIHFWDFFYFHNSDTAKLLE